MLKLAIVCIVSLLSFTAIDNVPNKNKPVATYNTLAPHLKKQVDCLADNIYFEAGNQSYKGKVAVGLVTINRVISGYFPDSVCGVVKQKVDDKCQFSWWCDYKKRTQAIAKKFVGHERAIYEGVRDIAVQLYMHHNTFDDVTKGATFFHASYISPRWRGVYKTIQIDNHVFYKKV